MAIRCRGESLEVARRGLAGMAHQLSRVAARKLYSLGAGGTFWCSRHFCVAIAACIPS